MSERRMRIVVTTLLVILANGLSVRSGDLPFHNTGTPAPFPTDDPPPVERSSQLRTAFFTTSPAAVSQPGLETPDWISRTGPLISQTRFVSPAVESVETRGGAQSTPRTGSSTADGTWREDGGFVIINLGGRELRLRKEGTSVRTTSHSVPSRRTAASANDAPASSPETDSRANDLSRFVGSRGGSVTGRLLNRGKPLVNCRVALIPIGKAVFGGYDIDAKSKPQAAKTDETGHYQFDDVPSGLYKLFWLPAGTRSWIRRIQFEPDAIVRSGERVEIKTVRLAVRTVN